MDPIIFYISAASDLEAEREVLGRAVTEVPVDLGWRVVQSPAGNGPVDFEAIASADLHVVLMGGDIRAPIGLEWQVAHQTGRRPAVYLKENTLRTPSGQDFIRLVRQVQTWERFEDGADLRRRVLMRLADYLVDHAAAFVLSPDQIAGLISWREALATSTEAVDEDLRGGAGESSVILSREGIETQGGVVIGKR